MKDFWIWATAHPWLAFILAWLCVWLLNNTTVAFFGMFHRRPQITFTDEQSKALNASMEARKADIEAAVQEALVKHAEKASIRTWHDRLDS